MVNDLCGKSSWFDHSPFESGKKETEFIKILADNNKQVIKAFIF